jgi:hypothetical protein
MSKPRGGRQDDLFRAPSNRIISLGHCQVSPFISAARLASGLALSRMRSTGGASLTALLAAGVLRTPYSSRP